jgi:hypothetical protein
VILFTHLPLYPRGKGWENMNDLKKARRMRNAYVDVRRPETRQLNGIFKGGELITSEAIYRGVSWKCVVIVNCMEQSLS